MISGRVTLYRSGGQAEANSALAGFVENEVTIISATPTATPIGIVPIVLCAAQPDLAAVVAWHHHHHDGTALFESSYCLSVDSPAWIALKATFPLPRPRILTWVFHLPARRTFLRDVLTKNMLAISIPRLRGALLLPDAVSTLREPCTAYELGSHWYQTLRKADQN